MRELNEQEMQAVAGGMLPQAGAVAVTFKTAYETATWYGAGSVGSAIGNALYDATEGS